MNTIGIDWNEVILLVIGALVGIGSSVAMMFIQNVNEKYGKMSIYTKFNCLNNIGREGWGIYDNPEGGLTFLIPTIFEIENTSKRARIMRDVTLVLMKENKVVAKMIQINYLQTTSKKNSEITEDDLANCEKDIQKLTDKYVADIDKVAEEKEKEIMSI